MKKTIIRLSLITFIAIFIVLAGGLMAVLYSPFFNDVRKNIAIVLLQQFFDRDVKVAGDVEVQVGKLITIGLRDMQVERDSDATDSNWHSIQHARFSFALASVIRGDFDVIALSLSGLKLDFSPGSADDVDTQKFSLRDFAFLPSTFLSLSVSQQLMVRNVSIVRQNDPNGWNTNIVIAQSSSIYQSDLGKIEVSAEGTFNGVPLQLSGHFTDPDRVAEKDGFGDFKLSMSAPGLQTSIDGRLNVATRIAAMDAALDMSTDSIGELLEMLKLKRVVEGNGQLTMKLAGPLDKLVAGKVDFRANTKDGDRLEVTGRISDLSGGEGIDLFFKAALKGSSMTGGTVPSSFDVELKAAHGKISGGIDGIILKELVLSTNIASANLRDIGPISVDRIVRDKSGRIALGGIRLVQGPADDPVLDLSGDLKDTLDLSGLSMKGKFNLDVTDILTGKRGAADFGRLRGQLTISDASGQLRLDTLKAHVAKSKLVSLDLRKPAPGKGKDRRDAVKVDLKIPDFNAFATTLGIQARKVGIVSFDGLLQSDDGAPAVRGDVLVGKTKFAANIKMQERKGHPFVSGKVSSELLRLRDLLAAADVYSLLSKRRPVVVELEKDFTSQIRVAIELAVSKISGGRNQPSGIKAKFMYGNGVAKLDPVRMSYLGGKVEGKVKVDTRGKVPAVALDGQVEGMNVGVLLQEFDAPALATGSLHANLDLKTAGAKLNAMARSASGTLTVSIWDGTLANRLVDLSGQDLVSWIFSGDVEKDGATLECLVFDVQFKDGRGSFKSLVFETKNVQLVGSGKMNFANDNIDLKFQPRPKHHELVEIVTPFAITGKLSSPSVEVRSGDVAGRAVEETLTLPLHLLGALLPGQGSKDAQHRPCVVKMEKAR